MDPKTIVWEHHEKSSPNLCNFTIKTPALDREPLSPWLTDKGSTP